MFFVWFQLAKPSEDCDRTFYNINLDLKIILYPYIRLVGVFDLLGSPSPPRTPLNVSLRFTGPAPHTPHLKAVE
jgi:hypothetical protein